MKQLMILRHAATEWSAAARGDRGRRLTDEGRSDARALGLFMKDQSLVPDGIYCSSAERTRETLDYLLPALGGEPDVRYEDALYGADEGTLLEFVIAADKGVNGLLVIAHNPGIHGFVMGLLSDVKDGVLTEPLMHGYPPGTLSVLAFDTDTWQDVAPHTGHLVCCKAPD